MTIKHFALPEISNCESLGQYFKLVCETYSECSSFEHMRVAKTYQDVWVSAGYLAAYLQSVGVVKGDRVAVMLPNCLQFPVVVIAILRVGAIVVNINPELSSRELQEQLNDAEPKVVFTLNIFSSKLSGVLEKTSVRHVVDTEFADLFPFVKRHVFNFFIRRFLKKVVPYRFNSSCKLRCALALGASQELKVIAISREDLAFLQYTGGTTGMPKAAMLSHGNLLSNIEQLSQRFSHYFTLGKECNVVALPMYHIFSLTVNFMFSMSFGCRNILIADPRELSSFIRQLKGYSINMFVGVNTLFNKLVHHKDFRKLNLSELKLCVAGGMPLQEQIAVEWKAATGHPLLEGYGLTEASPVVSMNSLENHDFNGSIGTLLPNTEVIFLDDNKEAVAEGETGELAIRGPQVMQGYWKQPEQTKAVMTSDGFLLTGDVGYMGKDGLIYLKERKKDLIIVSGFNVYPKEVESVLVTHPCVVEAAVIGVLQPDGSEKVVAYVVRNAEVTSRELRDFCLKNLTRYKVPKEVLFTEELPKSNVGKVLRRQLREKYLGELRSS